MSGLTTTPRASPSVLIKYMMVEFTGSPTVSVNTDFNFTCKAIYLKFFSFTNIPADPVVPSMPYTSHFNIQIEGAKFRFDTYIRTDSGHGIPMQLKPGLNTVEYIDPPIIMVQEPGGNLGRLTFSVTDDSGKPALFTKGVVTMALYDVVPI
jgi:hypothetical protein